MPINKIYTITIPIFLKLVLDGVTGLDFYLVDLSMGSIELSCTEIWHHDGSPSEYFDSDDNKISEEEYNVWSL